MTQMLRVWLAVGLFLAAALMTAPGGKGKAFAVTMRPVLRGTNWMVVAGRPLVAEAGAKMFRQGGNWVDAGVASLIAASVIEHTSFTTGGEVPALVYVADEGKVYAINGQGTAPTGATPEFFQNREMAFPPNSGPLAATVPGVLDAAVVALQRFGTMSIKDVLEPSIELTDRGFPLNAIMCGALIEDAEHVSQWKYSKQLFIDQFGGKRPEPGMIFRNPDLAETFKKLVEAEQAALKDGKSREEALEAARDRFYKGDIAAEYCRASQQEGGLHTVEDFAAFRAKVEPPIMTVYHGIDVYKCNTWTQGAVLLQTLNILEGYNLKSFAGPDDPDYIHLVVEAFKLAAADRDKYYGDPDFADVPIKGLLSKEYAADRRKLIDKDRAETEKQHPGDPWKYQGGGGSAGMATPPKLNVVDHDVAAYYSTFGTTSINTMDKDGNMFSLTPSGGWLPSWVAGKTGIPCSQRMQSFVLDPEMNAANVVAPGKRPRITLTPSLAFKDGKPFMAFSTQSGDNQDQALLQVFLNVVEWGMDIQEAVEYPRFRTLHLQNSFGDHGTSPGSLDMERRFPETTFETLQAKGHRVEWLDDWTFPCQLTAIKYRPDEKVLEGGTDVRGERWGVAW